MNKIEFFSNVGWWLPAHERHLPEWMLRINKRRTGRFLYQGHKYTSALEFVKQRRVAVDIGAHVGLWSWQMAQDFQTLHAFEPMDLHRECFVKNLAPAHNVTLYDCALGKEFGEVYVKTRTHDSSGDTGVDPTASRSSLIEDGAGQWAPMRALDEYNLQDVDFIKIDCEGYEVYALQGAIDTLKRCKPCVIVEQKPETGMAKRYGINVLDGVNLLESLGARRMKTISGDYIMSW